MNHRGLSRATRLGGLLALLISAFVPSAAAAQDVVIEGVRQGVQPPPSLLVTLQEDPGRFEFQRAWIQKLQRVRANRAALETAEGPFLSEAQLGAAMATMTGELKVPIIGALYSDQASALHTATAYQDRLLGDGIPASIGYTVRNYYQEISRNAFAVGGAVPTWATLPQNGDYYRPNAATDATFGRAGEFMKDALDLTDPGLDFGQFDNDGPDGVPNSGDDDGFVDVAAFLYQDAAKSCGGAGIWPHRWVYSGWFSGQAYTTNDAKSGGGFIQVNDYMIQAGLGCDGTSLMEIGTFSHELGHALGLPDLYDTDSNNGGSEGIGEWGLMGSGSWNRQTSPAHMSAWSKDRMGWVSITAVGASMASHTMPPVYEAGHVMRYNLSGATGEYFLLEHREATGSDQHIRSPGLLVWHVDSTVVANGMNSNSVNADEAHPGVDLEEADGLFHLESETNRSDAGDPFPGSTSKVVFNATSTPNSKTYEGTHSGFDLSTIAMNSGALTFDLTIGQPIVAWMDSTTATAGDTVTMPVRIDMSGVGKAIGSVQARLTFDTAVVSYLSMTSDFSGTFTQNEDSASVGILRFAGINTNASVNLDTTKVAILKFVAKGKWGSQTVLDLDIPELSQTDFTNVTDQMDVFDGHILLSPGTFAVAMRGAETVSKEESKPIKLRVYVQDLKAGLGSIQGRVSFGNSILQVDSVTAGDYGGTFDSNTAMQADSGFVRFAVIQLSPPNVDSADLATVWVTAKATTQGGDSTTVAGVLEEVTDPVQFADLLPFLNGNTPLNVAVSVGVWGDANSDKLITALDALVCLSQVVGKDVSQFDPTGCDVAPDDGAAFNGTVTALDALAILSYVVGRALPETFRVGKSR